MKKSIKKNQKQGVKNNTILNHAVNASRDNWKKKIPFNIISIVVQGYKVYQN